MVVSVQVRLKRRVCGRAVSATARENPVLSGLRNLGADLGIGHGVAIEVPGAIDGMDHVDEDLIPGLPAPGHLMDDVCRLLEVAFLNLPISEGKGRYFPFDEDHGGFVHPRERMVLARDMDRADDIARHDLVALSLI